MLTHLHVMVKHLWCWHICKGIKGGEKRDEVLPLVAPSAPIRCTATPRVVIGWRLLFLGVWPGWHRRTLSGATISCSVPQQLN